MTDARIEGVSILEMARRERASVCVYVLACVWASDHLLVYFGLFICFPSVLKG